MWPLLSLSLNLLAVQMQSLMVKLHCYCWGEGQISYVAVQLVTIKSVGVFFLVYSSNGDSLCSLMAGVGVVF